jgi:hypothetical protein
MRIRDPGWKKCFLDKIRKDQRGLVPIIGWAMDFLKGKESFRNYQYMYCTVYIFTIFLFFNTRNI